MSDQLAFDFTLPALQQTPAVQLPPHFAPESVVLKEDKFMYGGGSAKEAEFFKMFDQLAAESNRAFTAAGLQGSAPQTGKLYFLCFRGSSIRTESNIYESRLAGK